MSEGVEFGARPIPRTAIETIGLGRERIVFLASRQAVYQGLLQAAQKHFSAYDVSLVDQVSMEDIPDSDVRLALLGHRVGGVSINCVNECRRRFPAAAIGLVIDQVEQEFDRGLIAQRLVQGVLPLTLPLDVWLAIASLLVAGGEYLSGVVAVHSDASRYPQPHDLPQFTPNHVHPLDVPSPMQSLSGSGGDAAPGMESLTARERQILQLVSEGYQNKLIADQMSLSEHTVKAHVHNLIAKLRVTNRTQAAAAFLHNHEIAPTSPADIRVNAGLIALQGR